MKNQTIPDQADIDNQCARLVVQINAMSAAIKAAGMESPDAPVATDDMILYLDTLEAHVAKLKVKAMIAEADASNKAKASVEDDAADAFHRHAHRKLNPSEAMLRSIGKPAKQEEKKATEPARAPAPAAKKLTATEKCIAARKAAKK